VTFLHPQGAAAVHLDVGPDDGVTDVARREALLKTGALQNAILHSANFSSIATDEKGVIQLLNVGAERMLGYAAADVVDKITPADISDPQELIARAEALSEELGTTITPGFQALVFKASRGLEDIYELTYIRKDGSRIPAMVSVTALRDAQGDIIGYLLIGTDNTARKQIEAERRILNERLRDSLLALQEKNVELGRAKAAAEKANQAKSEFLSSMSHELRSPLNAILGFAQLMESDLPPPSEVARASIDQILRAGWYLLELINEILDLAAIESGRISLSMEPVSLAEVLFECHAMIESQAQRRGLTMTFPNLSAPMFVKVDRTRMKQVLINLLSNAIKYNQIDGEVVVGCGPTAQGLVRIFVEDTGAGLTPEMLTHLFEPFNRLGRESGVEEGTGIGLVVAKRLVELMGGAIGVESTVGKGSTFWIDVREDVAPSVALAGDEPTALPEAPAPDAQHRHTLLYVEDNPANLQLVEQLILRRPDMRLLSARDASEGIEIARAAQPKIILMDINLPGMSGVEALKILREDPRTAHIPVVALSANALPRDVQRGLEAGFLRYLTKPIVVGRFMATLTEALTTADEALQRLHDPRASDEGS
jgi:PAS domain S-box-containing protein